MSWSISSEQSTAHTRSEPSRSRVAAHREVTHSRFAGVLVWSGMLALCGLGCAAYPPAPPVEQLRDRATLCIHRAMRYPENPAVRAQGMETACKVLGNEAIERIREGLKDDQPGVRFAACVALAELGHKASIDVIRTLANDPDPSVRLAAYFALERMGESGYRRAWAEALRSDPKPEVRRNAAMLLGQLKDPSVRPLLAEAAAVDRDEAVRIQAQEGLAMLGDSTAINRFRHDAFGGVGYRQVFATLALGKVPGDEVVGTLRSRLEAAAYLEGQLAAARGLGMHGYPDGFNLAMESLNWNDPRADLPDDPPENQIMRIRSMAALALGDIGDPAALGALSQTMENSGDPRIQLAAARAIMGILKEAGGRSQESEVRSQENGGRRSEE